MVKQRSAVKKRVTIFLVITAVIAAFSYYTFKAYQRQTGVINNKIVENQAMAIKLYVIEINSLSGLFSSVSNLSGGSNQIVFEQISTLVLDLNNTKNSFKSKWGVPESNLDKEFSRVLDDLYNSSKIFQQAALAVANNYSGQNQLSSVTNAYEFLYNSEKIYANLSEIIKKHFHLVLPNLELPSVSFTDIEPLANTWLTTAQAVFNQNLNLQIVAWDVVPEPINYNGNVAILPTTTSVTANCVIAIKSSVLNSIYTVVVSVSLVNQSNNATFSEQQAVILFANSSKAVSINIKNLAAATYQLQLTASIKGLSLSTGESATIELPG